jgi:hypothetical protein
VLTSAWKEVASDKIGRNYAIRVRTKDRDRYFREDWQSVRVEIEGIWYTFRLKNRFWNDCPELRDSDAETTAIRDWLSRHHSLTWERRRPPHFQLDPLGDRQFRLLP